MENKRESLISKQERAAKQQELLERKRRAKAEFNTSDTPGERGRSLRRAKEEELHVLSKGRTAVSRQVPENAETPRRRSRGESRSYATVSQWFLSICWMNIPLIGFVYALVLAFGRKTPRDKKNFAKGYILYRLLVLLLAVTIMYIIYKVGLSFVDELLSLVR